MHARASEALDNYTTELNMNRSQVFNTRAQRCHDPKAKEILELIRGCVRARWSNFYVEFLIAWVAECTRAGFFSKWYARNI